MAENLLHAVPAMLDSESVVAASMLFTSQVSTSGLSLLSESRLTVLLHPYILFVHALTLETEYLVRLEV